jgi:glycosyltransferase involved in cell wall biosynthesis
MSPKVSVVVSCYNYGEFVTQCLDSIKGQTFPDFEVVIVNDGSTDNSEEQIKPYLNDNRFRYIKQKNGGQANAKNKGIAHTKGKYIAFLDADDLWEIDKLEKQISLFSSQGIGVVYSRARYIDSLGRDLNFRLSGKYLQPKRGYVTDFLIIDNFVPFSSSIVRRDCFDRFGVFDESLKMGIDWDLWLRISTQYQFDFVDEPLLSYRVGHPGQMSKNVEERQRCSDRIMKSFVQRYPNHTKKKFLRQAWAYTYMNRGFYHRDKKISIALNYYFQSFLMWPFSLKPMIAALKAIRKILIHDDLSL